MKRLWPLLALVIGLPLAIEATTPKFSDFTVEHPGSQALGIELPYSAESLRGVNEYLFKGTAVVPVLSQHTLRLIPDDCVMGLRIDGQEVSLNRLSPMARCNVKEGFNIELGGFLHSGPNQIEMVVVDRGGSVALRFAHSYRDALFCFLIVLWALALGALTWLLLPRFGLERRARLILVGALLVRLLYLSYTPYNERSHDIGDHLQYVRYVEREHQLPPNEECFECHQPPLYYVAAALIEGGARAARFVDPFAVMQLFSLLLGWGFVLVAALILGLLLESPRQQAWAIALVAFWPSAVMHSARLGNDDMLYFFFALSLYYATRAWVLAASDDSRDWMLAVAAGFAAILTKMSGLIPLGIAAIAFLVQRFRGKRMFPRDWGTLALFAAAMGVFGGFTVYRQHMGSAQLDTFNKFNWMPRELHVENTIGHFVWFDLPTFLKNPYINTFEDQYGRQYFWNFLARSSLFGEFWINNPGSRWLALAVGVALLFLVVCIALGGLGLRGRALRDQFPLVLNLIALLTALIVYRLALPAACNNDFRFIVPVLISLAAFFGAGLRLAEQRKIEAVEMMFKSAAFTFIVLSLAYLVVPVFV